MPQHKSDPAYGYYILSSDKAYRNCKICNSRYKATSSVTNLKNHLKNHPIEYQEYLRKHAITSPHHSRARQQHPTIFIDDEESTQISDTASTSVPVARPSTQLTIRQSLEEYVNNDFPTLLTTSLIKAGLPLSIIDNEDIRRAFYAFKSATCELPCRQTAAVKRILIANKVREETIIYLKSASVSSPVTIAIDGWTNTRKDKITNIMLLCNSRAFYYTSIVNKFRRNTADWIAPRLEEIIQGIIDHEIRISGIISDNESTNSSAFDLISHKYPFLLHIPCAAHTIQLGLKKILNLPEIQSIINTSSDIVQHFTDNKQARLDLREYSRIEQKTENPTKYMIIKPCTTRWSSYFYVIERICKLKQHINLIKEQSDEYWKEAADLLVFLKHFKVSTNIIQADCTTLFDVYKQFKMLSDNIKKIQEQSALHQAREQALKVLENEWETHIHSNAVIMSAILSFDPDYGKSFEDIQIFEARNWFCTFAANYLHAYKISKLYEFQEIVDTILVQLGLFDNRENQLKDLQSVIEVFKQQKSYTPRSVWTHYKYAVPELANAAIAILSMGCTEAAVERSFSAQAFIHRKLRNKLLHASVEAEMIIKTNEDVLRISTLPHPQVQFREIPEIYDPAIDDSDTSDEEEEENDEDNITNTHAELLFQLSAPVNQAGPATTITSPSSATLASSTSSIISSTNPSIRTMDPYQIYSAGDCCGILIESHDNGNRNTSFIPAIVTEGRDDEDCYSYLLAIKDYVIQHWFPSGQLIRLDITKYLKILGLQTKKITTEMINAWAYDRSTNEYAFISFETAVEHYKSKKPIADEDIILVDSDEYLQSAKSLTKKKNTRKRRKQA